MTKKSTILAFDHGTTGIKACLYDSYGKLIGRSYTSFPQIYPKPGWVEHDAKILWDLTIPTAEKALKEAGRTWKEVAAIGITNQRETTVLWDRITHEPIHHAIVWQCRRTADLCEKLRIEGKQELIQRKTGLLLDPYFSATKIRWILDHVNQTRDLLRERRVHFGTVDSWIIWNLSGGKVHITDVSNASRTLLYNIHEKEWDQELLELFNIPEEILPKVKASNSLFAETDPSFTGGYRIPIVAVAGDQQAALYGQKCWEGGTAKSTYGTGAFVVMNTGVEDVASTDGLLTTLAYNSKGNPSYALEGAIFIAGAALEWLQKGIGIVKSPKDVDELAMSLNDNEGVYFVPAFVGLGAPYWNPDARGVLCGLTQGVTKAHIARAALESMAYSTKEVIDLMLQRANLNLNELRVDGGVTRSPFLMQFLADILDLSVIRSDESDLTAKGVAYLAGINVGFWKSPEEVKALSEKVETFKPRMDDAIREKLFEGWKNAIQKV